MASFSPKTRRSLAGKDGAESFEALLAQHGPGRAAAEDGPDAAAREAAKDIAARIQAAVLETSPVEELSPESGEAAPAIEDLVAPTLFDEEFRARIIALVRKGLAQEAENGTVTDRRQLACFDSAVADGSIIVQRAEQVEGLAYRATRSVFYEADGRIVDDGSSETWDDDFVFAQMADGRSVIIGTAEAIGDALASHYYVSFPNPDALLTFDQQLYRMARQMPEEPGGEADR
jgi:hypothetical protein